MISSNTSAPTHLDFSDVLGSFFDPENFDPDNLPSIGELFGEQAGVNAHRKNLDILKRNVENLDQLLDVASRRLFLTDWHETSVRFFEQLASEAPAMRRLVARVESTLATSPSAGKLEPLIDEANAWVGRIEKIREDDESEHLAAVGQRFGALYKLHHREFEQRIAQLLNFDGFVIERWNGGAGDVAADVVARLPAGDGRRAIVQCKHTGDPRNPVGSGVIQQVSGARQVHSADLAFVVTTGRFTKPARDLASKLNVQLVDCDDILRWALGGHRVLDLLSSSGQLPESFRSAPI